MRRSKKLSRILSVQEKMQRQVEMNLLKCKTRQEDIRLDKIRTIEAMSGDSCFNGMFIDVISRRMNVLSDDENVVLREISHNKQLLIERGIKCKITEKLLDKSIEFESAEREKQGLDLMLDLIHSQKGGVL